MAARRDVRSLRRDIALDLRTYVGSFCEGLLAAVAPLAAKPEIGGRVPEAIEEAGDIRELAFRNHRIVYRIEQGAQAVLILAVVQGMA